MQPLKSTMHPPKLIRFEVFFLLNVCFYVGLCCKGYNIKMNYVRNCGEADDDIIQFKNITAEFTEDCCIIQRGCTEITREYQTGKARYKMQKPPMPPMTGTDDICKVTPVSPVGQIIATLGASECPMKMKQICFNAEDKIQIPSSMKANLPMLVGTSSLKADIEHDSGQSCLEVSITTTRK